MDNGRDISRIYIQNKSRHPKKFINILGIYKNDSFYAYKFTFEGFLTNKKWTFVENAVLDAVHGLRKFKRKFEHEGSFSVGYHSDGNIMYKVGERNFKPIYHTPINKINEPDSFLRISGFSLDDLVVVTKSKINSTIVDIDNYSNSSSTTCDIYMSSGNRKLNFISRNKNVFKDSVSYSLYDDRQNMSIHLLFYRADHKGVNIVIVKKGLIARINRAYQYFRYRFLNNIFKKN